MAGETYANLPQVLVDETALDTALANQLVDTRVEEAIGRPAVFVLRFRDPQRKVLASAGIRIGSEVSVFAHSGDLSRRVLLMRGEVTALEAEIAEEGSFTVVRGMDRGHRLLRGRRVATYRQMTASEIATQIADKAGLKSGRVDATSVVHKLLTQANCSDWDFLSSLAQGAGRELWVSDGAFNFCAPTAATSGPPASTSARDSSVVLQRGENLLGCRAVVTSARQVDSVQVRSWDPQTKQAIVAREKATGSVERAIGTTPGEAAEPFGSATYLASVTACRTQAEADQLARSLASDVAAGFAELEADALGNPMLRAGVAIALTDVGQPFEGRYTVTHTRHVFNPDLGYQTSILVSAQADRAVRAALTGSGESDAVAGAADRITPGVMTAVVADTKDPLQQGRVRLQFLWLSDDYVTDWVRGVQLGGVAGGGLLCAENGDEVLVAFEDGRLDSPYLIGGLYNGADKPTSLGGDPVDANSGKVVRRSWSSRSGNRVELLDVPSGPRGVRAVSGDGKLVIDLDESATRVLISSDGNVEITSAKELTVHASDSIKVASGGKLSLSGNEVELSGQQVSLQGTTMAVKGTEVSIDGEISCAVSAALIRLN